MGEWQARAQAIFAEMEEEYRNREQRELSGEWLTCCIRELLILLYRLCSSSYTFIHTSHGHIWEVKQYIEQHCTEEDLSISAVAQTFYSSIYYLTHTFKKVTGYTPKQYLQLCRLAAARELLYETDYNITEISQKAGFSDINNFIRYFKREVGVTPGQYRKGLMDKREDGALL